MKTFLPVIRQHPRLLMFGALLTFCSSPGQTYFIALFGGQIRSEFGLSHGDFGALYSAATLISAALLIYTGTIMDRVPLKRFSQSVTVVLVAGCFLMALGYSAVSLFIALLILRHAGQGLLYMTASTAMVRFIPEAKGRATAMAAMGYSLAEAVIPLLLVFALAYLSWRQAWFAIAGLLLCLPIAILWLLRGHELREKALAESYQQTDETGSEYSGQKQYSRAEVLRDPLFYCFMPVLMAQPLLFTGFMFHQVHLVNEKGWDMAFWGSLYLLYALVTVLLKFVAGDFIDRHGAIRSMPWVGTPLAAALLCLSFSHSQWAAVGFMAFLGAAVAVSNVVAGPFFAQRYGVKHLGAIKSLSAAVMVFMSALSPVILGWLFDVGLSVEALALGGVIYVVLVSMVALIGGRRLLKVDTDFS